MPDWYWAKPAVTRSGMDSGLCLNRRQLLVKTSALISLMTRLVPYPNM
jgi:hypothetical protein